MTTMSDSPLWILGFEFEAEDANARDIAAMGYGGGVPMGGDLGQAPNGSPVSLLIHAVKDPVGANLDRVQVIRGGSTRMATRMNGSTMWSGPETSDLSRMEGCPPSEARSTWRR